MKVLIFGLPGSGKTTLAKPFAKLIGGVHINADEGRKRQAQRMKHLADGVVLAGKVAVADFICPTHTTRTEFKPDFTVWMDTIKEGRFEDTNKMFEIPRTIDYHVSQWFDDTDKQLLEVVKLWMNRNGV